MKKVMNYREYVGYAQGKEMYDTSIYNHYFYIDTDDYKGEIEEEITSYDELEQLVKEKRIMNAELEYGLFSNKIKGVKLNTADLYSSIGVITRKNFKPIKWVCKFEEPDRKVTIKTLAELLEAEDFVEWCKDHGITAIPTEF